MSNIICICGRRNSGKDTFANILFDKLTSSGVRVSKTALADPLKRIVSHTLNVSRDQLEIMKRENHFLEQYNCGTQEFILKVASEIKIKRGLSCFIDELKENIDPTIITIITDLRYPLEDSEIDRLLTIKIKSKSEQTMEDEWYVDKIREDYLVKNDYAIEDLETHASNIINMLKKIKYY